MNAFAVCCLTVLVAAAAAPGAGDADDEKVQQLIVQLSSERFDRRWAAVRELGGIESDRAAEVLVALIHGDRQLRQAAGDALARHGGRAVKPLVKLMKAKPELRGEIATLLGRIAGDEVVQPLADVLRDRDPAAREPAAAALGRCGSRKAVVLLLAALKDPAAHVREAAAVGLADLRAKEALEPLKSLASDADPDVRFAAAWAADHVRRRSGDAAGKAVHKEMRKVLPKLQFPGIGLGDVLQFFRDVSVLNLVVEWEALRGRGIDQRTPVNIAAANITLGKALTDILSAADAKGGLTWFIQDGLTVVTTRGRRPAWAGLAEVPCRRGAAAGQAARKKLATVLPKLHFSDLSLGDAFQFMQDVTDIAVIADWEALGRLNVDGKTPIDLRLRNIPAVTALKLTLMYVDPSGRTAYMIVGDAVVVSTRKQLLSARRNLPPGGLLLKEWFGLRGTRYVLAAGENVRKPDTAGRTRLHRVAAKGLAASVKLLMARGADANARGEGGAAPLHLAAKAGGAAAVKALLEAGAKVDAADGLGRTALHRAVEGGRIDCVRALLAKGADVNRRDRKGRTPLDLAPENAKALVELLRKRGGK